MQSALQASEGLDLALRWGPVARASGQLTSSSSGCRPFALPDASISSPAASNLQQKDAKRVSQGRLSAQRQPRQDHACSAHATFREEVWRVTRWVGPEQRRGANRAHLLTVRLILISIILADKRSSISRAPHDAVHDGRGRRCCRGVRRRQSAPYGLGASGWRMPLLAAVSRHGSSRSPSQVLRVPSGCLPCTRSTQAPSTTSTSVRAGAA